MQPNSLSGNAIGNDGAVAIANALHSSALKELK